MPAETDRGREIPFLGIVGAYDHPQRRAPQMPVRIDKSRHHDHVARVNHLGAGGVDIGGDGNDRSIAHMHIGGRNIAKGGVHGQHLAAAHDEFTLGGKARRYAGCRHRTLSPRGHGAQAQGGGKSTGQREDVTAIQFPAAEHGEAPGSV